MERLWNGALHKMRDSFPTHNICGGSRLKAFLEKNEQENSLQWQNN